MVQGIQQITVRLKPGQDLREEIGKVVIKHQIKAGCILSVVGSLSKAVLRTAEGKLVKTWEEPFEVVSGTGTVSVDGSHIHIVVSNKGGETLGGHLKPGCIVRTTVEVVLLIFSDIKYRREYDKETGYDELVTE